MNTRLQAVYDKNGYPILPIKTGMFVEIHEKVGDGRIWKFKGLVIKTKKENHPDGTFTVRRSTGGVTVEKIYPFSFGNFDKAIKNKLSICSNKLIKHFFSSILLFINIFKRE